MVHAETMGAADFVVLHVGHVFLDGASNGVMLCCSIAVPAGGVVCPLKVLIGATHGIAASLIGELLLVLASDLDIAITKLVITVQAAVAAIIRSQTWMGVRSTRALLVSLVLRLVFEEALSFRDIWNHLSGSDSSWVDDGKVEASEKVESQQSAVISVLFGNNITLEAVEDDESGEATETSYVKYAIN